MSRVIHLRTSDRNIAACFLILESNGHNTNIPISTVVHTVLDACITRILAGGAFKNFDIKDPATVIKHYTNEKALILPDISTILEPAPEDSDLDSEPPIESIDINIVESVLAKTATGGIQAEAPEDLPDIPIDAPPWEAYSDRTPFEEILAAEPKDILVEAAEELPSLQRAIEIVYCVLPKDQWGTARAIEMVKPIASQFQSWLDEQSTKKTA